MSREQKDNSGAIFRNTRKESDNHPDRTGSCVIGGKEYWISGWLKDSDRTGQYISLAFTPKEAKREQQRPDLGRAKDIKGDIPF